MPEFHFMRPEWLWALLPLLLLSGLLVRSSAKAQGWDQVIAAELLPYLRDEQVNSQNRRPLLVVALAWLLAALAMAGPAWEKIPQPVLQKQDALVILWDLSLSMLAQDMEPSRHLRARHKLLDLMKRRDEGVTALVAYAGDAHIVSPLTDDTATIVNLIPALSPTMMPLPGSNPVQATELALQLLQPTRSGGGKLLLLTDGLRPEDAAAIVDLLQGSPYTLDVIGIGTDSGGPIPNGEKGFLKDRQGNIVIPQLQRGPLRTLASKAGGRYTDIALDDSDLPTAGSGAGEQFTAAESQRQVDQWQDESHWLILALLPIALLSFRRGWLLLLPLLWLPPQEAYAFEWQDLWQTRDQQAQQALLGGNPTAAAALFDDPRWSGVANYQAADYEQAANKFADPQSADDWYNRANALARQGQLQEALDAYDQALQQTPDLEDAQFNRDLVEQLKDQQEQQPQDSEPDQEENQEQQRQDQNSGSPGDQGRRGENQPGDQSPEDGEPDEQEPPQDDPDSGDDEASQSSPPEPDSNATQDDPQQQQDAEQQERDQATEQWLRRIPDDPSGLLRRKFQYESRQRQNQNNRSNDENYW